MKRTAALLVVLIAATGLVAALVGPCDVPRGSVPRPSAPRTAAPDVVPAATSPRVRRTKPTPDASDDSDSSNDVDDGERFALRVRVVAEKTHTPVVGAEISSGEFRAVTAADGEATIDGLSRGACLGDVRARGFLRKRWYAEVPLEDAPMVIGLAAGVVMPVEVVDAATGRPVPGATLNFLPNGDHAKRQEFVTDNAGRAEANLPPDVAFPVRTRARGHFEAVDFVRTAAVDAPQPTLRVTLAPSATLRGVVRDPNGDPVEGALLKVADVDDDVLQGQALTDGAYEVDGLVAGASYTARALGHGGWEESANAAFTAGRDGAVVDLRLRKPGTLEFSAVDDDGAPVERLEMRLSDDDTHWSRSGGGGSVTESLAPGRYVLKAWIPDCVAVSETVDIAEDATTTKTIVLPSGESIEGVVVDETGAPVDEAHIRSAADPIDATAPTPWARTGEDGRFTIKRFAKGVHDVSVSPPFEYEDVVVRGVAAPSENQRFVVARRGTLSLRVVFENDARPAPNARIAFHGERDGEPWQIDRPLDADGRFETAWPAGVRGAVEIVVDGFLPATRTVAVPLGASVDLGEIRLRRGASLVGVARAPDGGPLSRCTLAVRGMWYGGRYTTDEAGRFEFDGLAPGVARIDIESAFGSFRVDVPSRGPVVLTQPLEGRLLIALVDGAGAPVAHRHVVVRDADGESCGELDTCSTGECECRLAPGKYSVEVDRGPSADVEVRAGDVAFVKLR